MTTITTKNKAWPPIHRLEYASGKTAWQVACMVNGERIREAFPTKAEAETKATQIRQMIENEGAAALNVPIALRVEADKCAKMLEPFPGMTITEAVEYYVERVLRYRTAPTVASVLAEMIEAKRTSGRRSLTIKSFRTRGERFCKTFGNRRLSSVTAEEINQWMNDKAVHGSELGAVSRINYLVVIGNLFNYGVRRSYCDANPVKLVDRPSREDGEPGIFTVAQCVRLLEHSEKYRLLPYVAVGLFAGLRAAEMQRLDWNAVRLSERSIIVGSEVAKKRSRRVVEINDTLAAWLTLCGQRSGPIVSVENFAKRLRGLGEKAGLKQWPKNGLRHSFASYHLAKHGDAMKTAFQMGNSATMVHNHYKGLVSNSDVQRFWDLRPAGDDVAGKIVSMKIAVNG